MRCIGVGLTWVRHGAAACHLTNQLPVRCASYSADFPSAEFSNLQPENNHLPKLMQAKHDGLDFGPFACNQIGLISILANNPSCCNEQGKDIPHGWLLLPHPHRLMAYPPQHHMRQCRKDRQLPRGRPGRAHLRRHRLPRQG
jgi:hypothetical protein